MDRKIGRTQSKFESVKDRGDLRKIYTKESIITEPKLSDRGDALIKNKINVTKVTKKPSCVIFQQKPTVKTLDKDEDTKRDQQVIKEHVKKVTDKAEKNENQIRTYLDYEGRRRLQKRYTLKLKNQNDQKSVISEKGKGSDSDDKKSDGGQLKPNNSEKTVKSEKRKEAPKRRPIIKTVRIKNDNRVYKAVTFVNQKNHTPLQIKIPSSFKKAASKSTETNYKYEPPSEPFVPSKISIIKEKKTRRREKRRKRFLSPELYRGSHDIRSPATEVAKWAPASTNEHTKPYYEAWVSTTLTAVAKCTDAEKEEIFRSIRRPNSPDLFYENFRDERFAGRIKVKTK